VAKAGSKVSHGNRLIVVQFSEQSFQKPYFKGLLFYRAIKAWPYFVKDIKKYFRPHDNVF